MFNINTINIVANSDCGNSRKKNEDNVVMKTDKNYFLNRTTSDHFETLLQIADHAFICAVSDGMGGHSSGEVASFLTVKYLSDHYSELIESVVLGEKAISKHLSQINQFVCSAANEDSAYRGMGATLCGIISNGYDLYGFNIGDSRLYQMCNGQLTRLSSDHTEGQRLLDLNLLTAEEVAKFPRRKHLYKYIGYMGEIIPDVFRIVKAIPGSILMLCSDGLTDVLSDEEINQMLKINADIKEKAGLMMEEALARNPGYGDNITVILIEF